MLFLLSEHVCPGRPQVALPGNMMGPCGSQRGVPNLKPGLNILH